MGSREEGVDTIERNETSMNCIRHFDFRDGALSGMKFAWRNSVLPGLRAYLGSDIIMQLNLITRSEGFRDFVGKRNMMQAVG